jgi:hypothetical protein
LVNYQIQYLKIIHLQIVIKQEELDYIRQIKEENIKLKEAVRFKDRELEQKNNENEGVINFFIHL